MNEINDKPEYGFWALWKITANSLRKIKRSLVPDLKWLGFSLAISQNRNLWHRTKSLHRPQR